MGGAIPKVEMTYVKAMQYTHKHNVQQLNA